jgi:hypothetical protein
MEEKGLTQTKAVAPAIVPLKEMGLALKMVNGEAQAPILTRGTVQLEELKALGMRDTTGMYLMLCFILMTRFNFMFLSSF